MTNTPCAPVPSAWRTALRVAAAVAICAAPTHGQPAGPALDVLSPDGARYLSGRERLVVRLTPAGTMARVEFFVDGQRVCQRERLPFECDWDAGAGGEARVVRVLATLADGRRLIRRVHTPARAGMVFRSAVDVVLIPAIVTDRQGRYVTDLAQDRFEIREDGVRQRVSYFSPPADGGLDLVVALDISGISQFAGDFTPFIYTKNGFAATDMKRVTFDSKGQVIGVFDNGPDRAIYQIPLAQFANPNALEMKNGNVFAESGESGTARVVVAGSGGFATFLPNSREMSNVDLADEFTRMIVTQTAYNSAASVFRTVDQMTETARDPKR